MAFTAARVPLQTGAQAFTLNIGSDLYRLRFVYADTQEGGWLMDLSDSAETPLVCGVPLRPQSNLLAQYEYLGLGFTLFLVNTVAPAEPPTYAGLGTSTELYVLQQAA